MSCDSPSPLDRRAFLGRLATSSSAFMGLASLPEVLGQRAGVGSKDPLPHHRPRARRVIYLHMMGGPSQLDLFDPKPALEKHAGEDLRKMPSVHNGQRITGMTSGQATLPLVPSAFTFTKHRNRADGVWISELLPHTARIADRLCVLKAVHTDAINHEPGVTFMHTGSQVPGRPAFGAWTSYGLGSANRDLPTYVVMVSQGVGNMQALSARLWDSGFLPNAHAGVRFSSGAEPVLFLSNPPGVTRRDRRHLLDALGSLDRLQADADLDRGLRARIANSELAFRMQASVPELADLASEDEETFRLYGEDARRPGSFARNCVLARRLVERGVRFVQLFHRGWDAHGNLPREIRAQCAQVDRAQSALVLDLERRGLLEDTLVIWGGEFGRTAYCQGSYSPKSYGRDHHPRCFTMWATGGGVQPGIVHGETDDFGYNAVSGAVHVHDLHATWLHLLGFDHERLTFKHQGRRFRLTDVAGEVVRPILA